MNKQAAQEIYQESTQLVKDKIDDYILLLHKQDTRKKMQATIDIINKSYIELPERIDYIHFNNIKFYNLRCVYIIYPRSIYYMISRDTQINGLYKCDHILCHAEEMRAYNKRSIYPGELYNQPFDPGFPSFIMI